MDVCVRVGDLPHKVRAPDVAHAAKALLLLRRLLQLRHALLPAHAQLRLVPLPIQRDMCDCHRCLPHPSEHVRATDARCFEPAAHIAVGLPHGGAPLGCQTGKLHAEYIPRLAIRQCHFNRHKSTVEETGVDTRASEQTHLYASRPRSSSNSSPSSSSSSAVRSSSHAESRLAAAASSADPLHGVAFLGFSTGALLPSFTCTDEHGTVNDIERLLVISPVDANMSQK